MLTEFLLQFALIGAEWVLWVLVILSLVSVMIMIERALFYYRRKVDLQHLRQDFEKALQKNDFDRARELLEGNDSMEARVILFALRDWEKGAAAVEDLVSGALATEKNRYERFLSFLGTVGNNAPFIGLFGTVLGIIGAFANLAAGGGEEAKALVMAAISEALVATGVGLLVAIPAVIAFNYFRSRIKTSVAQTELLGRTLLAYLHGEEAEMGNV
jgi:biopolymer transport protein ExbB